EQPRVQSGESPCTGPDSTGVALTTKLRELARAQYGDRLISRSPSTVAVVWYLVEQRSCTVARDTLGWIPRQRSYDARDIASRFLHVAQQSSLGLEAEGGSPANDFLISYVVLPTPVKSPSQWNQAVCGIGSRSNETCSFDGSVVIRRVDSVRVLIAMVGYGAPADTSLRQ